MIISRRKNIWTNDQNAWNSLLFFLSIYIDISQKHSTSSHAYVNKNTKRGDFVLSSSKYFREYFFLFYPIKRLDKEGQNYFSIFYYFSP